MFKYVMTFSKTGTICYTSHLDMMKLFKRVFKRAGFKISYSQGFNPHPKMGFAQPLSLGYWGMKEMLEFETDEEYGTDEMMNTLKPLMPEGLVIIDCIREEQQGKTLAARTVAAEYIIAIPLKQPMEFSGEEIKASYMEQDAIITLKKQKKKKDLVEVDIKPMIRDIGFVPEDETLFITALLDSGSNSNLSPELLITTVKEKLGIETDRSEIQVMRKEIFFEQNNKW